jgi:hypothetical protein
MICYHLTMPKKHTRKGAFWHVLKFKFTSEKPASNAPFYVDFIRIILNIKRRWNAPFQVCYFSIIKLILHRKSANLRRSFPDWIDSGIVLSGHVNHLLYRTSCNLHRGVGIGYQVIMLDYTFCYPFAKSQLTN